MIADALRELAAGRRLTFEAASRAVETMMRGDASEAEMSELLLALRAKGESVDELAGAAAAMRRHMTPIRSTRTEFVDTCGTGGGGSTLFNISTAAAIVTAAAGLPVAKHGNRRITSRSGSADVLRELGVDVDAPVERVEQCLESLGICFCFAPLLHSSMRNVSEVRRKLGVRTIFNLLGPLANPASAPYQLLGVGLPESFELVARALARLGTRRSAVVHGEEGLGEVSLAGPTRVMVVEGHQVSAPDTWAPEDFGLSRQPLASLSIKSAGESAAVIRDVLAGQPGPARDIVILNAAAALWVAGKSESKTQCAQLAATAIDSGTASGLLTALAEMSRA